MAVLCLLLGTVGRPAAAQNDRAEILRDVGIDQHLDEPLPLDAEFRDENGATVRLGEYFGERPVIVSLVYYECPMLCTLVLRGLVSALRTLSFDVGDQFEVVTVSFDPGETPELAAAKKKTILGEYRRPGAAKGWHFLTGDPASIERLTKAFGFRYRYDPESDEFAHASAILVATPAGRIARYFYGVEYPPRDLRLGLIEAAKDRIGSPVDQLLLYCYRYDPSTGRYSAAVMNIVRLGGVVTLLGLGALVFVMSRRGSHARDGR